MIANAGITPALYDKISAGLNEPSQVRYSSSTGRIVAATTGRLIAQITSPHFLDYELLADFFLTFRNFVSTYECLDYLMARMQWALANDNDAGRIVRVRTFVALRHWILNYFSDDFVGDYSLRQRLCRSVNDLSQALRLRQDQGGSDINVIGELKKCWRRTCAMFWPTADGLETSPDLDIAPGQDQPSSQFGTSTTSLPLTVRRNGSRLDFRRSSQIQILVPPENTLDEKTTEAPKSVTEPDYSHTRTRTASIPTSPMSEQSLEVLSCSVPFLRYVKPMKAIAGAPRPPGPQRNPPLSGGSSRPVNHAHKRSGSFSDALRDKRPPLPSGRPQSVDLSSLRSYTFTGGLVRGLLLQPSPSKVDLLIPLSPSLSAQDARGDALEGTYFQDHFQQNAGAKKIVRDVRRALSSRKDRHDSPASSHRSTNSSDSRLSGPLPVGERQGGPSAWQQLRGPPRTDMLGERLEASYKEAFQDTFDSTNLDPEATEVATQHGMSDYEAKNAPEPSRERVTNRMNSHITTGSRSIVIVDDTGIPEMPEIGRALPSVSTWDGMAVDPLFYEAGHAGALDSHEERMQSLSTKVGARDSEQRRVSDSAIHDLLTARNDRYTDSVHGEPFSASQARKSSSVNPSGLDMPPIRNQLRRRPGGDLKAADHVHDLEPEPRPYTGGSFSTLSYSVHHSAVPSSELSGTHFSGQALSGFRFPQAPIRDIKNDSLGLLQSQQPDVRPSMERQMSQLAKLPDEFDDGGIENALAKLEGKASSPAMLESSQKQEREVISGPRSLEKQKPRSQPLRLSDAPASNRQTNNTADNFVISPRTDRQGASIYGMSDSDAASEIDAADIRKSKADGERRAHFEPSQTMLRKDTEQSESTMMFMDKSSEAEKPAQIPQNNRDTGPTSATSQGSFLLDDNESLSDISTEIADHSGDDSLGVRSFFFDDTVDDEPSSIPPFNPPPTPPSTVGAPRSFSPERKTLSNELHTSKQRALKEAASAPKLSSNRPESTFHVPEKALRRAATQPAGTMKAHLPFVLAFESDVIAEQLTIIEKDAIDEVDWKDLIALNWQQAPAPSRNWVDFLARGDVNGIDIVIARFNLVVKWVVSECVLTASARERAQCITKYIHVAAHAHRLRNYASTYQITLALLSADLARLPKTWALVPAPEKATLARFERLCQPVRNFQTLRAEMEAHTADAACIPFIGLYTHDLVFNAQKPARVEPTPPGREPLVNFERFQTAAMIVKSLLRLIETSSNYVFHPHPEVLSRCLWLAALEDAEIAERCKGLD